jgi:hypothetical protein
MDEIMSSVAKPDFIVVGYPRSGTTWLYDALKLHSQVFLPERKELHYYDRNLDQGLGFYKRYFPSSIVGKIKGEITPVYTENPWIAERIYSDMPEVKIIIVVRNPVERLRSIYLQLVRDGRFSGDFSRLLLVDGELTEFAKKQLYSDTVAKYLEFFGANQVHVAVYDDLIKSPLEYAAGITRFLDISDDAWTDKIAQLSKQKSNPGVTPRSFLVHRISQLINKKLRLMHNSGADRIANMLRSLYAKWFSQHSAVIPWDDTSTELVRSLYQGDVVALGKVVGRDLEREWQFTAAIDSSSRLT